MIAFVLITIFLLFFTCFGNLFSQIVSTTNTIQFSVDTLIARKPKWVGTLPNGSKHFYSEDNFKNRLYWESKLYKEKDSDEKLNKIIDTIGFYCLDSFGNEAWRKTIVPQSSTNSLGLQLIHLTNDLLSVEISSNEEDYFYSDGIQLNRNPQRKLIVFFDTVGNLLPYRFEVNNPHFEDAYFLVSNMIEDNTFAYLFKKQGDFSINQKPFIGEDGIYIVLITLDNKKKEFVITKSLRIGEYFNSGTSIQFRYYYPFTFNLLLSEQKKLMIQCSNKLPDSVMINGTNEFESIGNIPKIILYDENLVYQSSFNIQSTILKSEFDNSGNLYVLHTYVDTNYSINKFVLSAIDSKGTIRINDTIDNGLDFSVFHNLYTNIPTITTFNEGCFVILPTYFGNENKNRILRIKQYFSNGEKSRYFESKEVSITKNEFSIAFEPIRSTNNVLKGITTFNTGKIVDFEKGFTSDASKKAGYSITTLIIDESKYLEKSGFTSMSNRNFSFHTKELWDFSKIKDSLVLIPELIYIRPYDTISYNITIVKEDGSVLFETSKPQKGLRVINYDAFSKGKYTIVVTSVDEKLKNTYDFEVK
jgi:hypothetical protein